MNKRQQGSRGEEAAAQFLIDLGYRIHTRNYHTDFGEIDCIAETPDGTMVFFEVKSGRHAGPQGHPFFRITRAKQRQVLRTAKHWLFEHGMTGRACRFDAVAVTEKGIEHLKNAFMA